MQLPKFEYLYFYQHERDTAVAPHYHNCYELTYYCEGNSRSEAGERSYNLHASDYMLYPPLCIHNEVHLSVVKVLCLGFTLTDDTELKQGMSFDSDKFVYRTLEQIRDETFGKSPQYWFMCSLLTGQLVIRLLRKNGEGGGSDELSAVYRFINENFNQNIDLHQLSELSGYSYDRFRHLFKQRTGATPLGYILNKKIEHAKLLLSSSSMQVADIATACGFSNISQFSVSFKKAAGITPSGYRERNRSTGPQRELP